MHGMQFLSRSVQGIIKTMDFSIGKHIQNLRLNRKPRKLTRERLAELVGVTPSTIYRWENDEVEPKTENIRALSKIFSVSISSFYEPYNEGSTDSHLKLSDLGKDAIIRQLEAIDSKIESIKSLNEAPIDIVKALKNANPGQLKVIRKILKIHPSQGEDEDDQKARSSN